MCLINKCLRPHRHRWENLFTWGGPYPCVGGEEVKQCTICNKQDYKSWIGIGHSYTLGSNDYFYNPDGSYGYSGRICINCGSSCDHQGAYEGESGGWHEFSCGTCGYQYYYPVAECQHYWMRYCDQEATCTSAAVGYEQCMYCGATNDLSLTEPALGHDPQEDLGAPGTYYCSRCGQYPV